MARLAQKDRGARLQLGRRASNGETTGRWRSAAIASLAPVTGARKALMGGARLPGRERSRGRGARLTGGVGVSVVARARGDGPLGPWKGGECARARERGGLDQKRPNRGGGVSFSPFFLFLISIFYFYFYFFYLLFF
jgi:hypothetical protein